VPGIVPDDVFFRHLSQRRFPAAVFFTGTAWNSAWRARMGP
jgi:phenylalanine-4-hydroxylase